LFVVLFLQMSLQAIHLPRCHANRSDLGLWDICFSVGSRIADLQGITSYSIKKTQHCKMILIALCILLCIRSSLCVLSCSDILQSHPEFYGHDGVYKLNDDELYCDMTTDGNVEEVDGR